MGLGDWLVKGGALGGAALVMVGLVTGRLRDMSVAIRRSEDRFRSLVEQAADAFFLIDRRGKIVDVNQRACDSLGYSRAELLRLTVADIDPGGTSSGSAGILPSGEGVHVRKDGSTFPVDVRSGPFEWQGGSALLALVRDIGERKEAQEALAVLAKFSSESTNPVLRFSADGTVLYSNSAGAPLLEEWGTDVDGVLPEAWQSLVRHTIDSGQTAQAEVALGIRSLSVDLVPVGTAGYVNMYGSDITARKHAESELQEFADRLERSNRDLEHFAYVAAHDLQEPLRKIQTFADRLVFKGREPLSTEGRGYLDSIQGATERMRGLIDGLLAYSRVTTSNHPFAIVDLGQVAREVLSDLDAYIERVGGRVELSELPILGADPVQMRQLLQNLIHNGLKFHKPDRSPTVRVDAKCVPGTGGGDSAKDAWRLIVSDDGIGFDERHRDRMFAIFQRLNGRGQYDGNGIGLALCARIVERHEGRIEAESTEGEGATFTVTLPLNQG
jgi:PAS domain S-box-containing protein